MTSDSKICEALVAHDEVIGAVVNVASGQTHLIWMHVVKRPQFYLVGSTERWRRNSTPLLVVATRHVLMSVLWVT